MTAQELDECLATLSPLAKIVYAERLCEIVNAELYDDSDCYYPGECGHIDWDAVAQLLFATPAQKFQAYSQTIRQTTK